MSYPYENRPQSNSALEALKQKNSQSLASLELRPYEPTVYAIPVEQRQEELALLKQAVTFQPELYSLISQLATREELSGNITTMQQIQTAMMEQSVKNLTSENSKVTRSMKESVLQAGRDQEKFISTISSTVTDSTSEMKALVFDMRRRMYKLIWSTAAVSVLLSILACVAFWQWVV